MDQHVNFQFSPQHVYPYYQQQSHVVPMQQQYQGEYPRSNNSPTSIEDVSSVKKGSSFISHWKINRKAPMEFTIVDPASFSSSSGGNMTQQQQAGSRIERRRNSAPTLGPLPQEQPVQRITINTSTGQVTRSPTATATSSSPSASSSSSSPSSNLPPRPHAIRNPVQQQTTTTTTATTSIVINQKQGYQPQQGSAPAPGNSSSSSSSRRSSSGFNVLDTRNNTNFKFTPQRQYVFNNYDPSTGILTPATTTTSTSPPSVTMAPALPRSTSPSSTTTHNNALAHTYDNNSINTDGPSTIVQRPPQHLVDYRRHSSPMIDLSGIRPRPHYNFNSIDDSANNAVEEDSADSNNPSSGLPSYAFLNSYSFPPPPPPPAAAAAAAQQGGCGAGGSPAPITAINSGVSNSNSNSNSGAGSKNFAVAPPAAASTTPAWSIKNRRNSGSLLLPHQHGGKSETSIAGALDQLKPTKIEKHKGRRRLSIDYIVMESGQTQNTQLADAINIDIGFEQLAINKTPVRERLPSFGEVLASTVNGNNQSGGGDDDEAMETVDLTSNSDDDSRESRTGGGSSSNNNNNNDGYAAEGLGGNLDGRLQKRRLSVLDLCS